MSKRIKDLKDFSLKMCQSGADMAQPLRTAFWKVYPPTAPPPRPTQTATIKLVSSRQSWIYALTLSCPNNTTFLFSGPRLVQYNFIFWSPDQCVEGFEHQDYIPNKQTKTTGCINTPLSPLLPVQSLSYITRYSLESDDRFLGGEG